MISSTDTHKCIIIDVTGPADATRAILIIYGKHHQSSTNRKRRQNLTMQQISSASSPKPSKELISSLPLTKRGNTASTSPTSSRANPPTSRGTLHRPMSTKRSSATSSKPRLDPQQPSPRSRAFLQTPTRKPLAADIRLGAFSDSAGEAKSPT